MSVEKGNHFRNQVTQFPYFIFQCLVRKISSHVPALKRSLDQEKYFRPIVILTHGKTWLRFPSNTNLGTFRERDAEASFTINIPNNILVGISIVSIQSRRVMRTYHKLFHLIIFMIPPPIFVANSCWRLQSLRVGTKKYFLFRSHGITASSSHRPCILCSDRRLHRYEPNLFLASPPRLAIQLPDKVFRSSLLIVTKDHIFIPLLREHGVWSLRILLRCMSFLLITDFPLPSI